jgi:hypothetical protein
MLSIIRLKSAEEYEELQSEESRIAESFSKNTLQTIQNPFARTLFAKNPSFASPACCWVAADGRRDMMSKKKEQEQDGELDGAVRTQDQLSSGF